MKVGTLVKHLKRMDPDMRVVVNGYKAGLCDLRIRKRLIAINVNGPSYFGPHEDCATQTPIAWKGVQTERAVLLERVPNPLAKD